MNPSNISRGFGQIQILYLLIEMSGSFPRYLRRYQPGHERCIIYQGLTKAFSRSSRVVYPRFPPSFLSHDAQLTVTDRKLQVADRLNI